MVHLCRPDNEHRYSQAETAYRINKMIYNKICDILSEKYNKVYSQIDENTTFNNLGMPDMQLSSILETVFLINIEGLKQVSFDSTPRSLLVKSIVGEGLSANLNIDKNTKISKAITSESLQPVFELLQTVKTIKDISNRTSAYIVLSLHCTANYLWFRHYGGELVVDAPTSLQTRLQLMWVYLEVLIRLVKNSAELSTDFFLDNLSVYSFNSKQYLVLNVSFENSRNPKILVADLENEIIIRDKNLYGNILTKKELLS